MDASARSAAPEFVPGDSHRPRVIARLPSCAWQLVRSDSTRGRYQPAPSTATRDCPAKVAEGAAPAIRDHYRSGGRLGTSTCPLEAADHAHALAGAVPILALDMYEHSYHMDFGAEAGAYVDAFMDNVTWARIYQRYQTAVHHASEPWRAAPDDTSGAILLDVRRAGVYEQASTLIPGARRRDPARVVEWSGELPVDREVIVYCVYGHEVGRATAMRLRAAGLKARYLRGGIDGWQAAGHALNPKGAS